MPEVERRRTGRDAGGGETVRGHRKALVLGRTDTAVRYGRRLTGVGVYGGDARGAWGNQTTMRVPCSFSLRAWRAITAGGVVYIEALDEMQVPGASLFSSSEERPAGPGRGRALAGRHGARRAQCRATPSRSIGIETREMNPGMEIDPGMDSNGCGERASW